MLEYEKVYLAMVFYVDRGGKMTPTNIQWENGRTYHIDKVLNKRISHPEYVGASITGRYDVVVEGKKKILYLDTTTNQWFIERPLY